MQTISETPAFNHSYLCSNFNLLILQRFKQIKFKLLWFTETHKQEIQEFNIFIALLHNIINSYYANVSKQQILQSYMLVEHQVNITNAKMENIGLK